MLRSEAELEGKVARLGVAGDADDHVGAAPPAYGRRRPAMSGTGMETMRELWCSVLRFEKCPVRQMKNSTTL